MLVDDSHEFLDSAVRFLSADPRVMIVGHALSGDDALEQIQRLKPDLVLMDLAMPGMNGLQATSHIKAESSAPYVIILTLYDSPEYRAAAADVGADGFIIKSEFGTQVLPLIDVLFG